MEDFKNKLKEYFVGIDWSKIPFFERETSVFEYFFVLLTIIFAWLAYRSAKRSEKREIASILADRVDDPEISIFDFSPRNRIVYFAPFASNKLNYESEVSFAFPLKITILNPNLRSIDDAELYLKLNAELYRSEGSQRVPGSIASAKGIVTASEIVNGEKIITVFYRLGHLPPKDGVTIEDKIFCTHPTDDATTTVDATTADGVDVSATVSLNLSFSLGLILTGRDIRRTEVTTKIGFRRIPSEGISRESLESYLDNRRAADGSANEADLLPSTFIIFDHFERPEYDIQAVKDFKKTLTDRDEQYLDAVKELVPRKFSTEAKARKYLWTLSQKKILEGRGAMSVAVSVESRTS